MSNLSDLRKQAEKEGQVGSGVFKPQEGANRLRFVAGPLPHSEMYQGERRFKWLCYVLDRADKQVKPYFLPHSIFKMLEALSENEEYAFDGFPIPYDVSLNAKGAGTRDVEYTVVAARKSTPLTSDEQNAIDAKQPLAEFQAKLRERKAEPTQNEGGARFDPDEIPF